MYRKYYIFDENPNELIYKINYISSSLFTQYLDYKLTDDANFIYLIVYGKFAGTFTLMLSATDVVGQTVENPIDLTIMIFILNNSFKLI